LFEETERFLLLSRTVLTEELSVIENITVVKGLSLKI